MHGLGGFKEQPHIQTMAHALRDHAYTTVLFDTKNSLGESDGEFEQATSTNYFEDLEDVINWAKQQTWYKEPFLLVGHSIGALCCAHYAQLHPKEVKALAPISTVVSGALNLESPVHLEDAKEWKRTGWLIKSSVSKPGVERKLPWSHIEDRMKFDLLPNADKLTIPVLMIVGQNDSSTPPEHHKIFFDAIKGPKELHIIKNAEHTFRKQEHLDEISLLFNKWLEKM